MAVFLADFEAVFHRQMDLVFLDATYTFKHFVGVVLAEKTKMHVLQLHVGHSFVFFMARDQVLLDTALDLCVVGGEHSLEVFELLLVRTILDQAVQELLVFVVKLFVDQKERSFCIKIYKFAEI